MASFKEVLECKIFRESDDSDKRTVIAGVLEADFLSANKRFYPEAIVRKVSETLKGKPSMIGHDTNSPRDVVARITDSRMNGKKLIASFQFGTDTSSQEMFQKVKDGLVDSYSIRAWGESKPGKINNEDVDIVTELNIETVDLVVTPGVSSAKVLKVFESSPEITFNKENDGMDIKELESQLAEANRKLKAAEDAGLALTEANKKAEEAKAKAELERHMAEKLGTVKEEYRGIFKEACGDSKDIADFDKRFEAQKKVIEAIAKTAKVDVAIHPTDGKNEKKKYRNANEALESPELTNDDKTKVLVSMLGGKVK